jgi:dTDP-4-amino-4,6-dideoxygalactose transaminase
VALYDEALSAIDEVIRFRVDPRASHVYHLFVVQVPNRDEILARLRDSGIGAGVHYPTPVHLQPAWTSARPHLSLPNAEVLAGRIVTLPLFPTMSASQVERTVEVLDRAIHGTIALSQ